MKKLLVYLFSVVLIINTFGQENTGQSNKETRSKISFTEAQKKLISNSIKESEINIRKLLPLLPKNITVFVQITNKEFKGSGGVSGRADRYAPAEVFVELSRVYPGGVDEAIKAGLIPVIYHEFHHLFRHWTIKDNKYSTEIYIAAVNEGLAVVFSEIYTDVFLPWNEYSKDTEQWVNEIIALPKNSNYQNWMFQHPDGRIGIGYKTGNFIIRKALNKSDKNILELSKLSPKRILKLAGYKL